MAGLGCKIGDTVVAFNDMTPEAWERVGRAVAANVTEVKEDGTEVRASWIDVYAWPMRFPGAARVVHEEAVRVVEPGCPDIASRSRELAGSLASLRDSFVEAEDDIPAMQDGAPLAEAADG